MNAFTATATPGYYRSTDRRFTAELRPAGWYSGDLASKADRTTPGAIKLVRHYAIRNLGQARVIGTAKTLKEAGVSYR